jgi:hypothetical protein
MWGAVNEIIRQGCFRARALSALTGFRDLIEDARAMHLGTFRERVEETTAQRVAAESKADAEEDLPARHRLFAGMLKRRRSFCPARRTQVPPLPAAKDARLRSG